MTEVRKEYPRLIRMVERQAHSKFKKKPTLIFVAGGTPRNECLVTKRGKRVAKVRLARVEIPKRMARENVPLTKLAILHELRGLLAFQNGNSPSQSHKIAHRSEKSFRKKLGLDKSGGWLLHDHYRRNSRSRSLFEW